VSDNPTKDDMDAKVRGFSFATLMAMSAARERRIFATTRRNHDHSLNLISAELLLNFSCIQTALTTAIDDGLDGFSFQY